MPSGTGRRTAPAEQILTPQGPRIRSDEHDRLVLSWNDGHCAKAP